MRNNGSVKLLTVGLLIVLVAAQAFLQKSFERRYPAMRIESLLYIPRGGQLKVMSLGFRSVLADALWVKAIGYFGGHVMRGEEYPWLYHILDQVTSLDPPFRHAYFFGGVVLAVDEGAPEKSIALLRKGMIYYPGDWRFPFFTGFNYFYYLKDPVTAADYIGVAATVPGHPKYLPQLAASLLARSGRLEAAITFLETIASSTEEEWVRSQLYRKIERLKAGEMPRGLEDFLGGQR